MKTSILIVISKSPHGSSACHEGIDLALAAASFEQRVAIAFEGDGALCFSPNQDFNQSKRKNLSKMLKALPVFGIQELFLIQESDNQDAQNNLSLPDGIEQLEPNKRGDLYSRYENILHF